MTDIYADDLPDRLVTEVEKLNIEELIHEEKNWDTFDEVVWYLDNGDEEDMEWFITTLKMHGCDADLIKEVEAIPTSFVE